MLRFEDIKDDHNVEITLNKTSNLYYVNNGHLEVKDGEFAEKGKRFLAKHINGNMFLLENNLIIKCSEENSPSYNFGKIIINSEDITTVSINGVKLRSVAKGREFDVIGIIDIKSCILYLIGDREIIEKKDGVEFIPAGLNINSKMKKEEVV